jgi:hypothetical protein
MAMAIAYEKLTSTSTTKDFALGTRVDVAGNTYIYLEGVASTAQYDWVTYNESYATARLVPNAVGPVAIAQAAIVASNYGWYLISGVGTGSTQTVAADKAVYAVTAGKVDDAAVTGDLVLGAASQTTDAGGTTATFSIAYPFVTDVLG